MTLQALNISQITAAIGAIDTNAALADLLEIDAELNSVSEAKKDLERQLMEATRQRAERQDGPDPALAASALIEGVDVLDAVESIATLDERIAVLRSAKRGLAEREHDARAKREEVTSALKTNLREALAPLSAAIDADVATLLGQFSMLSRAAAVLEAMTGILSPLATIQPSILALGYRLGVNPASRPIDESCAEAIKTTFPILEILGLQRRAQAFVDDSR